MLATVIFLILQMRKPRTKRLSTCLTIYQLASGGVRLEWAQAVLLHNPTGQHRDTAWIPLQERVCYLAARNAVDWQCLITMSEFVNKDYTLPGLSAASCLMSGAEGLGFGISAHCESPLVGNYALKPLWPDKNLTDLYLSVRLFFSVLRRQIWIEVWRLLPSLIKILHS